MVLRDMKSNLEMMSLIQDQSFNKMINALRMFQRYPNALVCDIAKMYLRFLILSIYQP